MSDKCEPMFIVIVSRAYMNERGFGFSHYWDRKKFKDRDEAIRTGLEKVGSDDFNIGVVVNGLLTSIDWMNEVVDTDPEQMREVQEEIAL